MKYYLELIFDLLWWVLIVGVIAMFILIASVATSYLGGIDDEIQHHLYFHHPYFCKYILSPLLIILALSFGMLCLIIGGSIVTKLKEMRW